MTEFDITKSYLRCTKVIGGETLTTGWAPSIEAAERHAESIGGEVKVTYNGVVVATFTESHTRNLAQALIDTANRFDGTLVVPHEPEDNCNEKPIVVESQEA